MCHWLLVATRLLLFLCSVSKVSERLSAWPVFRWLNKGSGERQQPGQEDHCPLILICQVKSLSKVVRLFSIITWHQAANFFFLVREEISWVVVIHKDMKRNVTVMSYWENKQTKLHRKYYSPSFSLVWAEAVSFIFITTSGRDFYTKAVSKTPFKNVFLSDPSNFLSNFVIFCNFITPSEHVLPVQFKQWVLISCGPFQLEPVFFFNLKTRK